MRCATRVNRVTTEERVPCRNAAVARGARSRQVVPAPCPQWLLRAERSAALCRVPPTRRAARARSRRPPPPHFVASPPMVIRHPDGTLRAVVWYTCSSRATPSDHAPSIFRVVACGLSGAGTKLRGAPKDSKRSTALSKAHASPDGSAHQGRSLMDRLIKAPPCKVPKIGSSSRYGSRDRASS